MNLEQILARLEEIRGLNLDNETTENIEKLNAEVTELEARKKELEDMEARKIAAENIEAIKNSNRRDFRF
jgi:hypothetical protein